VSPLRDLEPRFDPKGGSPKTPIPIPIKDLQAYVETGDSSEGVWKVVACSSITALIGMTVAWFTALQSHGVSQKDMQDYVDKFSPYSHDKEVIAIQQANQDRDIGSLLGHKDRIFDRLKMIEEKHISYDRDMAECDNKIKMLTNYIEAEKFPKK